MMLADLVRSPGTWASRHLLLSSGWTLLKLRQEMDLALLFTVHF